ncbi:HAD family acid phosphatase [Gryllotalpicola daejeonensis]|uniref:HAD family acid phosphatase n=1 Tax=Gryllotalpicola daejeonensis TaxID=993087 RepID=A0ABP7ZNW5_9MICO
MTRTSNRLPILIGAALAAGGLVLGGTFAASAHPGPPSAAKQTAVDRQAAGALAMNAAVPTDGNAEPNIGIVEDQIKAYYGAATTTYDIPGVGDDVTATIPSSTSNYAKQMAKIVSGAEKYLSSPQARAPKGTKPAVVFDVDDTLLNTYDYEVANAFGYNPTVNGYWVNAGAFPAVPGMVGLYKFAKAHGYTVFFITGRPEAQRAATEANLASTGYGTIDDSKLFLKQPTTPPYLSCAAASCTTIEYKSGTRAHIESQGYTIVADFGDQYSDLTGAAHGEQYKLPNPMYYLP